MLQHQYNTWVKKGKKPLSAEQLDKMFEESLKNQEEPQSSDMGPVVQQVEINENGNRMTYEGMQLYQNFYHFVNQAKTVFFL